MGYRGFFVTGLVAVGAVSATPASATFSGIDGRVSFTQVKSDQGDIRTAHPDGGDVDLLTDSGKDRAAVVSDWSPDGTKLAFDSNRVDSDGRKRVVQIYVMNADGSGQTQLTRSPGFHGTPGWSPDGASIAIDSDWGVDSMNGIWVIPAFDPDGVTALEARRVTTVPANAEFDSEPQFSPDGQMIVFTRFRSTTESAIHVMNADGSNVRRVTPWALNASDPDFSPDGERITFDSGDGGEPGSVGDIYVANVDGSAREKLTDSKPLRENGPFKLANNPVFSPSGTRIMYTQFFDDRNELRVFDVDGSNRETVHSSRGFPNKADWGVNPPG